MTPSLAKAELSEAGDFHPMRLGQAIRAFREKTGLKGVELARLSGINPKTIAAIEKGHIKNPSLKNLQAIARSFKVPLAELFVESELASFGNIYQGDQKGEVSIDLVNDHIRMISYVPINSKLFVGKVVLAGRAKLRVREFPCLESVFGQVILGKLKVEANRREFVLKEGDHFLLNGRFLESLQNPLLKEACLLLVTAPSIFSSDQHLKVS